MEQKDYKLEIMQMLMKKPNHVREIAKLVGTNHMTISRKMIELKKMNVVDCRNEGKNKVYFIKNSHEAKNYIFITEHYKLMKLLEKYPSLRNVIEKIRDNEKIRLALLFGSYAKGLAKKDSDIDIFIDGTDRNIRKELETTNSKLSIKLGNYDKNNLVIKEVNKNHVIIKGVEEYYGKREIFEET